MVHDMYPPYWTTSKEGTYHVISLAFYFRTFATAPFLD